MTQEHARTSRAAERAAHIKALVDAAPPLSRQQVERLRLILFPAVDRISQ